MLGDTPSASWALIDVDIIISVLREHVPLVLYNPLQFKVRHHSQRTTMCNQVAVNSQLYALSLGGLLMLKVS